jgi:heptosyltransferase-2
MENPPGRPPSAITPPRRILVRGVNWLGDAVMTTPALLRLRESFSEAHIALLTPEKLTELWRHHPAVNEAIPFVAGEGLRSVSRGLRAGNFDLALVLPNSPRSAMEPWLARIPQRIGYARPWRNWFLTEAVASRPGAVKMPKRSEAEIQRLIAGQDSSIANRQSPIAETQNSRAAPECSEGGKLKTQNSRVHQLHDYLHLVAALGGSPEPLPPRLFVQPDEIEVALRKFNLTNITSDAGPIFGLNAGAEYGPAKRWPADRFIAAAREIQKQTNCVWLILGGKGDVETAARIESETHNSQLTTHNLAGKTSLRELMALLKSSRVLLTNDTGPMHVAAALGTPVVVPFGSTSPELTGPGLPGDPRHHLLKSGAPCSPCFLRECPIDFRCMTGIGVDRVVAAVLQAAAGNS